MRRSKEKFNPSFDDLEIIAFSKVNRGGGSILLSGIYVFGSLIVFPLGFNLIKIKEDGN